jgi:uncharacterized small protein (DUF1192 family)
MRKHPLDWFKERIASATVLREVYAAAGLDACANVMQEEIDRLNREYARLLAERAAAMLAERKAAS